MSNYQPNVVPLFIRLAMAFSAVFLVFFAAVQLMTGYTYILSKRGGILLHGMPSLMVVLTVIALCAAELLTIVDHYDKRQNEEFYKNAKSLLLKSAAFFFFAGVPIVMLLALVLQNYGIYVLTNIPGLAENYNFYTPELKLFIPYLDPIKSNFLWIFISALILIIVALIIIKLFEDTLKKQAQILLSLGLMGFSALFITGTIEDFLSGEVDAGRRSHKYTVSAWSEPAKFNAIILTHFTLGGAFFMTCATVFVGRVTRQIQ